MTQTTAVMKRDSVLTCEVTAACNTLKTAGAIRLHSEGGAESGEGNGQNVMPDSNARHELV